VPAAAYVCGPVTAKPVLGLPDTTPGVAVPSPQVIVAMKSESFPNGLASENVATGPVNALPAIAATDAATELSGASRTFSSNGLVKCPSLLSNWTNP
jgi:hypothetical protein